MQALTPFPRADGPAQFVTVGYDGYIRFSNPVTGEETASYAKEHGAGHLTNAVNVDEGATLLAVSEDDGSIELLEFAADGRFGSRHVLRAPGGVAVLATALVREAADSILVAAACEDGTVHLFSRSSGQEFVILCWPDIAAGCSPQCSSGSVTAGRCSRPEEATGPSGCGTWIRAACCQAEPMSP